MAKSFKKLVRKTQTEKSKKIAAKRTKELLKTMKFEQAEKMSFSVPWKATECFSGPECWCRIILPKEPIYYQQSESEAKYEYVIVDAGSIDQKTAEYIVKLHNEHLENN